MKILCAMATLACVACVACAADAAPMRYAMDPNHTYPSFTTDHMGGLSTWRGKFNHATGTVVLDRQAGSGSIDVEIDAASIDLGNEKLNEHVKSADMLDVASFPTATYTGKLVGFENGAPTAVDGMLTLHGVSRPVKLKIDRFMCKPHPMTRQEVCGAAASGSFDREDFGIDYGKQFGFDMRVGLQIQVEASPAE